MKVIAGSTNGSSAAEGDVVDAIQLGVVEPAVLLAVATAMTAATDGPQLARVTIEFLVDRLGAAGAAIGLLADDDQHIEVTALTASVGDLTTADPIPLHGSLSGRCVETGEAQLVRLADHATAADVETLVSAGSTTVLCAPLISADHCLGSLNVGYREVESSGHGIDDQLEIVDQFARLLASQIDRIRLHERLQSEVAARQRQTENLSMLSIIERDFAATTDLCSVLGATADVIDQVPGVASANFIEIGTSRGNGVLHRLVPLRRDRNPQAIPVDYGNLDAQLALQSHIYFPDVHAVPQLAAVDPTLLEQASGSVFVAAVRSSNQLVGFLMVASDERGIRSEGRALLIAATAFMGGALDRIKMRQRLDHDSRHDHLTGLALREFFEQELENEIDTIAPGEVGAVAFIDVDRFKVVNDTRGHRAGDDVLIEVAGRISRLLTSGDVFSRVGGDEFVVLLRGRTAEEYSQLCERVVDEVATSPFTIGRQLTAGTVSVGYTLFGGERHSARELVAKAHAACESAKVSGGNRASSASNGEAALLDRVTAGSILLKLRTAIERDELLLFAQPIKQLSTGQSTAFEVLVRMQDGPGVDDIILPSTFLPIAERYGAIEDLDAWVTRSALQRLAECEHRGSAPSLFINLSPTSITADGFADRIAKIVNASPVDPGRICFEITETGTMRSFERAVAFVERMSDLGARIALDDFGVGLSSLSHLQRLPIDVLKIDGSLIRGIERNPLNQTLVGSIQAMADALGIETVGEHIENDEALAKLAEIHITSGQGYYLGRPVLLCDLLSSAS